MLAIVAFVQCAFAADASVRGAYPILTTPYLADGAVDYDSLVRETEWADAAGVDGIIWPQSDDSVDLLTTDEKKRGMSALAEKSAAFRARLCLGVQGRDTAEMLALARYAETIATRHDPRIIFISRPADNCRTQEDLERYYDALDIAETLLVNNGGLGHTSSLWVDELAGKEKVGKFAHRMKTCRLLVNTPSSLGGIGDIYNFRFPPSLTLGCGSWGGNSVSENVGVKHLLNIKTVAMRRENMLWFRAPEKVYQKKGCLAVALRELGEVLGRKKAFIVTDSFLYANGYTKPVEKSLAAQGILFTTFSDVAPDPTLACAKEGAKLMAGFRPDVIIAVGGGSAMDAAKIMWVLYEHPEADFQDLAMRFMDIRKRVYPFPKMGGKAYFICVPTSAGTGSEVTPFAVITDEKTGTKYPLADYELMPKMAIVDADMQMMAPPGLTSASGIDAVAHALEAYASMMATDYTDGLAIRALQTIFKWLPACYDAAVAKTANPVAREKMANAATMAGMAFANAFLGVMHSMAHKLGAFHHIPHGIANALMMEEVLRFNADPVPRKMGTFPQYDHPHTLERYLEIADALGIKGRTKDEQFENFVKAVRDLRKRIGIKPTIRDYVPDEKDFLARLDAMTEQAFDDQCTGANPRYPLMSEIRQMYLNAYYGRG